MIAYKGFNKNLESVLGNGDKRTCTFTTGERYIEKQSKTGRTGYHCCENPFDCLRYYSLDGKNRFFLVEAEGNINEDEIGRIACTEITLKEELDIKKFAFKGMEYMIMHPKREKWQREDVEVIVTNDSAEGLNLSRIVIARGENPRVKGKAETILGILKEGQDGTIIDAAMMTSEKEVWYVLENGKLKEEK